MLRYDRSSQVFATCLSAVAGYVDAIGYLHLGGFFASFMTGNSTKLGIGLAAWSGDAATAATLIATFVAGVMLGTAVSRLAAHRGGRLVLALVAALLLAAASLHTVGADRLAVIAMVLAMGAENAAFQHNGEVAIGLTYMTGTLVKMGQRLTDMLLGGDRWAWLPYALLWCGLVVGAVLGAATFSHVRLGGLWAAGLATSALALLAAVRPVLLGEGATPRSSKARAS